MLQKDPLFKALTRPAVVMGVPLVPFFLSFGIFMLLAVYTKIYYFIFWLPILGILRLVSKIDEKIFQLLGIKRYLISLRMKGAKFKNLFNGNYYTSSNFSKQRVKNSPVTDKGEYTMLDLDKAIPLEKIIPYSSHIAENVVLTRDGFYTATWEIEGISYETRDDEEIDRYKMSVNTLLRTLAQENFSIYTHTVRNFSKLRSNHKFENEFAKKINDNYINSFSEKDFMENSLFITLAYLPYKGIEKANVKSQSKKERLSDIEANLVHFQEMTARVENALNKFGCNRLSTYEENDVVFSQLLELYQMLLTGRYQKVRVLNKPIYSYLGNMEMICGKDITQVNVNGEYSFVRGIEIKDWVQDTGAGFLDVLNTLNCRYTLTQSFSILNKTEALKLLNRQINQLKSTLDDSISQQDALLFAKDQLTSGDICFGEHHFTLMIYGDSMDSVKRSSNEALTKLSELGFVVTLSNISLDEAYFSQLPCNFKFRPRTSLISSLNFSGLNSLHNNPIGKSSGNCWGNAITLLKTNSNSPFYFNFHQTRIGRSDFGDMHLGHSLILGQSGAGKTVLASFLLSQISAFSGVETFPKNVVNKKLTAIYFDKDYGAEIAVRAMGGQYNRLRNGKPTGFNPFMLDNTVENVAFLNSLVSELATSDGSTLSTRDKEQINFAVKAVLDLPKYDRKFGISRLLESIQKDHENENSLYLRLRIWQQGGVYGWVFDNESDQLSFDEYTIYGFDGTEILDNSAIVNVLAYYLLYRISMVLDGRRLALFLDEFWKWLQGAIFAEYVYDLLKTMRKKNGIVIMITQSPSEIINSKIARAVIEQVETFIYLPNSRADEAEYTKHFKLSEKEYRIVKNLDADSRMFLVKKGNENDNRGNTVLAKLDLSGLSRGDMKVLSGSADNVPIIDRILKEYGENPADWLPVFQEEMLRV